MDPVTDFDTPEDYIENEDGSVTIPDMDPVAETGADFYENLAESLDSKVLQGFAGEYVELLEKDREARTRRDQQYEEGIRRTGLGDDAPGGASFQGASKVVHPILAESCVDFAASSIKELYPSDGPVKTKVFGEENDPVFDKANRKKDALNWQLTEQIPEYRGELEQLLTQLPLGGSQFLKFWYDAKLRRPTCEFVPIDDILLPFAATNFYTSHRVTHVLHLTEHTFKERVRTGLYVDLSLSADSDTVEQTAAAKATNKIEGKDDTAYNEDGLRDVYEIYTWLEIKDDVISGGELAPYILTIDSSTEEVLAVYRNWDQEDATFEKLDWLIEFKFIPWRGAYAIGLPHLIGGISAALTGALRALLDSAHISNAPSAVKLKGGRVSGKDVTVEITQVTELEAPPGTNSIRDVIMPLPFNPPSPVLFSLLGFLTEVGKGVVSTAEEKIADASGNMPVGTTLALIEQGSKVFSAIHARLHSSQKKVLQVLARINKQYMSVENFGPLAQKLQPDDFNDADDVVPVSDPTIFSESQRFAQMQAILQMMADPTVQWNKHEGYRRTLKLMRVENPDALLPPAPKPVTADPVSENMAAQSGMMLKAHPQQDDLAHINAHVTYVQAMIQNPLANPVGLMGVLNHIGEHINNHVMKTSQALGQQVAIQAQVNGQMISPDAIAAMAQQQALQMVAQQVGPLLQSVGQLKQQLASMQPQPPMPPEVQASLQIPQMEHQRKSQMDKASFDLQTAKQQSEDTAKEARFQMEQALAAAEEQREQQRMFMEQAQQQFDQRLEAMRQMSEERANQLSQQVELIKNKQDNERAQMVDLLKNHEDNQTRILIEQMGKVAEQVSASSQPKAPDMEGQMKQLQQMLDQISKDKTNDALAGVLQGLQVTMQTLNAPKMIIRDAKGKAVGVQSAS